MYTGQSEFLEVIGWLKRRGYTLEYHMSRTRFWIPKGFAHTLFLLRWGAVCTNVDHETDHALGR